MSHRAPDIIATLDDAVSDGRRLNFSRTGSDIEATAITADVRTMRVRVDRGGLARAIAGALAGRDGVVFGHYAESISMHRNVDDIVFMHVVDLPYVAAYFLKVCDLTGLRDRIDPPADDPVVGTLRGLVDDTEHSVRFICRGDMLSIVDLDTPHPANPNARPYANVSIDGFRDALAGAFDLVPGIALGHGPSADVAVVRPFGDVVDLLIARDDTRAAFRFDTVDVRSLLASLDARSGQ